VARPHSSLSEPEAYLHIVDQTLGAGGWRSCVREATGLDLYEDFDGLLTVSTLSIALLHDAEDATGDGRGSCPVRGGAHPPAGSCRARVRDRERRRWYRRRRSAMVGRRHRPPRARRRSAGRADRGAGPQFGAGEAGFLAAAVRAPARAFVTIRATPQPIVELAAGGGGQGVIALAADWPVSHGNSFLLIRTQGRVVEAPGAGADQIAVVRASVSPAVLDRALEMLIGFAVALGAPAQAGSR
jgi:hypothetical protein